jgi:transcriptional regulator with XRE-family HTH domain
MAAPKTSTRLPFLRAWRLVRMLTQRELVVASGVSESVVERAERGLAVRAVSAAKLAHALSITVKQLQEEEPHP